MKIIVVSSSTLTRELRLNSYVGLVKATTKATYLLIFFSFFFFLFFLVGEAC